MTATYCISLCIYVKDYLMKKYNLLVTAWECKMFSATQILREINFENSEPQNCEEKREIFSHLQKFVKTFYSVI